MSRVSVPWLTMCSAQDPPKKKRGTGSLACYLVCTMVSWGLSGRVSWSNLARLKAVPQLQSSPLARGFAASSSRRVQHTKADKSLRPYLFHLHCRTALPTCTLPCFTCTAALPYLVSLALLRLPFLPFLHCLFLAHSCTADWPTVFRTLTVLV